MSLTTGTNSTPNFAQGGNVFGRIASQWNSYFRAKVDATSGFSTLQALVDPTISGGTADFDSLTVNGTGVIGIAGTVAPLRLSGGTLSISYDSKLTLSGGTALSLASLQTFGTITVTGSTNLSTLSVGTATVAGNAAVNGTLTVVSLSLSSFTTGTLTVTGSATISGTLNGNSVKNNGNLVVTKVNIVKFLVSGTYTPTPGTVYAIVECVGGGGGGGGESGSASGLLAAGGGGSGGYSRSVVSGTLIGASKAVTVGTGGSAGTTAPTAGGTGGDTSFGTIVIAKGGNGGGSNFGAGGAGGVAGTGDVTFPGNTGESGANATITTVNIPTGGGAPSVFGGAPLRSAVSGSATTGASASANTGAGGSGGASEATATAAAGGAGGTGIVIITEYINA